MIGYGPDLDDAEPYPGAPRYFKQYYDLRNSVIIPFGGKPIPIHPDGGMLMIYGYGCASTFEEDKYHEQQVWAQSQRFLAWCFSTMCPQGEPGFVYREQVFEITREELEEALRSLGSFSVEEG